MKRKVVNITDCIQQDLKKIEVGRDDSVGEKEKTEYKKRKLVNEVQDKIYNLSKGPKFSTTISKAETELTPEMISSGSWKTANFKPYNFSALGISPTGGHLHPLLKVNDKGFCFFY